MENKRISNLIKVQKMKVAFPFLAPFYTLNNQVLSRDF